MPESSRPRLTDVRMALRVVGECRDLAYDPARWRAHAATGLGKLLGSRVTAVGECVWKRPGGDIVPIDFLQVGLTPDETTRYFVPFFREPRPDDDLLFRPIKAAAEDHVVRTRRRDIPDDVWYRCRMYTEYHEPVGVNYCAASVVELPGGRADMMGLHRDGADRDFSARDLELLRLFHAELGRLIGPVLVAPSDPYSPSRLPPRVREALECLLDGDSEKQAAARMGLSVPTVHQYVTALYRHYRVTSRAELLARVLRRRTPAG